MPVFYDQTEQTGVPSVAVPTWVVRVARIQAGAEPADPPTWDDFEDEPRLQVLPIFYGSGTTSPNHAKLRAVTGPPLSPQVNVEASDMLLMGDKVILGVRRPDTSIVWKFGGFMVRGDLTIDGDDEDLIYHVIGPEWQWGIGGKSGCGEDATIVGQWRRRADADSDFINSDFTDPTPESKIINVPGERTIFNPNNRGNMTAHDVLLIGETTGGGSVLGRVWESPERVLKVSTATAMSAFWTRAQACKTLFTIYNDPANDGITCNWTAAAAVLDAGEGSGLPMRDVDVDGMSLWEALKAICAPDFDFYVNPIPTTLAGSSMSGFQLIFYDRSKDVDGTSAALHLDVRGTPSGSAKASVNRLQAVRDAGKCANRATILGKTYVHLRLAYHGDQTPSLSADPQKTALQHGWGKDEGDLAEFAGTGGLIDQITIENKAPAIQAKWRERFRSTGKDHGGYRQVFRMFMWNEAVEKYTTDPTKQPKYGTETLPWFAPNLTGICDGSLFGAVNPGRYVRRKRRMLDTAYKDGAADSWRRVPPTLWIAAIPEGAETPPTLDQYVRVPQGTYQLDPERCAIYFTAPDLAEWKPLADLPDENEHLIDFRGFATLLHTGKLRLILEGTVEDDLGLVAVADRTEDAAVPMTRDLLHRVDEQYVRSATYSGTGSIGSPTDLTPVTTNQLAEADRFARRMRGRGEVEQVHASILLEADWPLQKIGKMAVNITGRNVNLASSGGRGAQIVAYVLDPVSMQYELLTESAALELAAHDRLRIAQTKEKRGRGRERIRG